MGEAHHQNHRVYILEYHLRLVVKYRKKCITPEIGQFLIAEADQLLRT